MKKEIRVSEEYKIAVTEVLYILEYLPQSEVDKIPNKFKEFLKENSLPDYNPCFDYSLGLDKIKLKRKTKLLLAMIYKNYLCSEEELIEYNKILYQNEEIYQKQLRNMYNLDNLPQKTRESEMQIEESKDILIEYKESFFSKFKNFVFKIFHINKHY